MDTELSLHNYLLFSIIVPSKVLRIVFGFRENLHVAGQNVLNISCGMTEKNCILCPYRHYTYRQRSNHTTSAAPKPQRTIKQLASGPQRRHSSPFCYSHFLIWMLNVCSMEIEKKHCISWLLSGFFANTIPQPPPPTNSGSDIYNTTPERAISRVFG